MKKDLIFKSNCYAIKHNTKIMYNILEAKHDIQG